MSSNDWTPTQPDPARRLVQVRKALVHLHLDRKERAAMEEFAGNLERKYTKPTRAQKGN